MNLIINKLPSGFYWENRYAKRFKDIGLVLFVGFILLAACAFVAASKGYPSLGQGLAIGAASSFILAFLTIGPNPWATTTKGLNRWRHTRDFTLGQFWSDRGLLPYRDTDAWIPRDPDIYEPGIAEMFSSLEVWQHDSTGLRVRYATYRVPKFGPRDVKVGFMGVFILSLDNNWSKRPSETEILRIEGLESSPCVATLITDFPPDVLRAVLNQFADKFSYLFDGADGFLDPKDLIDALAPQGAEEPKKAPPDLKLVPAT